MTHEPKYICANFCNFCDNCLRCKYGNFLSIEEVDMNYDENCKYFCLLAEEEL